MFRKTLAGCIVAASLGMTGPSLAKSDIHTRIDALADELRALKAQMQIRDSKIEELEAATSGMENMPVFDKKKLRVSSRDGKWSIRFGGRIQMDASVYDYDDEASSRGRSDHGIEFRRVRFFANGTIDGDWKYKLQLDFDGDDSDHKIDFKDVYIAYTGIKGLEIKAGHFKAQHGLEELTSSKYITFMERTPMSNAGVFIPGRQTGLQLKHDGPRYGIAAGYFFEGDAVLSDKNSDAETNEGFTGRIYYSPVKEKTRLIHLGLGASYRNNAGNAIDLEVQPNNHNAPKFLDTKALAADWKDRTAFTPEMAVVYGPFSVQAEYTFSELSGKSGKKDIDADAGYIFASYFLTGESRPYKKGKFGRVKTRNGIEIAARYDTTDFSDKSINDGGKVTNLTVGLNYYFNPQVRAMFNYVDSDFELNGAENDIDGSSFGTRLQVDF